MKKLFLQIIAILIHIYSIFDKFHGGIFVISIINLAVGCFGLFSLYKENGTLMKIFGIILIIVIVVMQVLEILGLLMLTLFREVVLDEFLKELMSKYYDNADEREIIDGIQQKFQCCGRQSHYDWHDQPYSCCKAGNCSTYFANGCVYALSSIAMYIFLVYGLICVCSIVVHIYAVVSAFDLARVYRRGPIQPSIKHNYTNF